MAGKLARRKRQKSDRAARNLADARSQAARTRGGRSPSVSAPAAAIPDSSTTHKLIMGTAVVLPFLGCLAAIVL
ncbi:MAG TPA: hypothetical protein VFV87_12790, partial [Pirellulaceae bacterium]|nr:hypothetical protein [Pirellulaceae bacterium]